MSADARILIERRTDEIRGLVKRTGEGIFEIGSKLLEVKQQLKHGQFNKWLDSEFEWGKDTASRFMNVAKSFGEISQIAKFAPSALYVLARPKTPEAAREEAIDRAKDGESITVSKAEEIFSRHKRAESSASTYLHKSA